MAMLLLCISCNCHHQSWVGHPGYQVPNDSLYALKNQVIVWKNPKYSEEEFQKWLTDLKKQRPSVQALAVCSHCDSDMLLLYDTSLLPYLQNQTVGGNGGSPLQISTNEDRSSELFAKNACTSFADRTGCSHNC